MSSGQVSVEDYEAIESAVMETERGRWFLREFAARNRNADTAQILQVLDRLEERFQAPVSTPAPLVASETQAITPQQTLVPMAEVSADIAPAPLDDLLTAAPVFQASSQPNHSSTPLLDITTLAQLMAHARHEMANLREEAAHNGRVLRDGPEFDAISAASDNAINSVLNAAERIQEISWMLRERGGATEQCDELDRRASEIYLACSFQDMTSRHLAMLVETLHTIDAHFVDHAAALAGLDPQVPSDLAAADLSALDSLVEPVVLPSSDTMTESLTLEEKLPAHPSEPIVVPHPPALSPRQLSHPRIQHAGNLALAVEPEALPEAIIGIDYNELSFNEKIALFS